MNYLRHATKHISHSHNRAKNKKPVGFLVLLFIVGLLIATYAFFGTWVGNMLFGIKNFFVPNPNGQISLLPSAYDARMRALEIENDSLLQLLNRSGVDLPPEIEIDRTVSTDEVSSLNIDERTMRVIENDATSTETGFATTSGAVGGDLLPDASASGTQAIEHVLKLGVGEVVASVLVRPPQSPYDSLVINVGEDAGLSVGNQVYAFKGFPIGTIIDVKKNRSTVRLLSAPGSKIDVLIGTSTQAVTAEGKGAGNFFLKLPKVTDINEGDLVARNFLPPEVFSTIESVDSEAGEAYIYAYFKLPVNLNSLVYVLVKKDSTQ